MESATRGPREAGLGGRPTRGPGTALAPPVGMPSTPRREPHPKKRPAPPPRKDDTKNADEVLREQAKTEIEERPYLDTEGGE